MSSLLAGKTGIIFGVANDRSYATHIASSLASHGATCAFSHLPGDKNKRRTSRAVEKLGISDPWLAECDAGDDESIDRVFEQYASDFGRLDFIIHSIAFADRDWLRPGMFNKTPREAYLSAVDISAYTLSAFAQRAKPLMEQTSDDKPEDGDDG